MISLILAQVLFPTPAAISTPAAPHQTEAAVMTQELDDAAARRQKDNVTLGAVVIDLATGARAERNADVPLPLSAVDLPLSVLAYRAFDEATAQSLLKTPVPDQLSKLGGVAAINADLNALGFGGIVIKDDGSASATANALGTLVQSLTTGKLLSAKLGARLTQDRVAGVETFGKRSFVIVALASADKDPSFMEDVRRAAKDAADQFPL